MTFTIDSNSKIDWTATGADQIKNNVLNIIRTRKGEVPYLPRLGISPDYVDTPLLEKRAELMQEIREQLSLWEPDARLDDFEMIVDTSGDYIIKVVISI